MANIETMFKDVKPRHRKAGMTLYASDFVGILGAVRAWAMRPILEFKVHSLLLLIFPAFHLYPLYF